MCRVNETPWHGALSPRKGAGLLAVLVLLGACARSGEGGPSGASGDVPTPEEPDAGSPNVGFPGPTESSSGADAGSPGIVDASGPLEDAALAVTSVNDAAGGSSTVAPAPNPAAPAPVEEPSAGSAPPAVTADAEIDAQAADSGEGAQDATFAEASGDESPPTCAQTCAGCCESSGACSDGTSDPQCGVGGVACLDCSSVGQTCQSGACVAAAPAPPAEPPPDAAPSPPAPAPDAGGPSCDPSACSNLCVPYFVQCCRADSTCGCALLFPRGPCN
jgi:hypothetical protein